MSHIFVCHYDPGARRLSLGARGTLTREAVIRALPWDRQDVRELILTPGVTALDTDVFSAWPALERVTLPEGLERIGEGAFRNCRNLRKIHFPATLWSIGGYAFAHCPALEELALNDDLEELDLFAFSGCRALTEVRVPGGVKYLGDFAFSQCEGLRRAVLEEGVEEVALCAFCGCTALTSVSLPESLRRLEPSAFFRCEALAEIRGSLRALAAVREQLMADPNWVPWRLQDWAELPPEAYR